MSIKRGKISAESVKGTAAVFKNLAQRLKLLFHKYGFNKEMSKKRKLCSAGILCLVLIGGYFGKTLLFAKEAGAQISTATVTKKDIQVTITGSGTVAPLEQYDVVALVQGDVLADYFKEGDAIEKGTLLYQIDASDMENTIERAQLGLSKSQLSYQEQAESYNNLKIVAPFSGTLSSVSVKAGDKVNNGGTVAQLDNSSYATVTVPYLPNLAANFYVGQSASIVLSDSHAQLSGTITRIASGSRIIEGYYSVKDVEIRVDNPGNILAGQKCQVTVGGSLSYWEGEFSYEQNKTITAEIGGTVKKVYYLAGDTVKAGEVIAELISTSAQNSLTSSKLSLKDAELSLQNYYDQLDNYNLTSPISGTVMQKNVKAGDTLEGSSSSKTTMAVIADLSKLLFTISVDELDITSIKEGQTVTVTADATPNVTYTGTVTNVSLIGTSSNGVTTYPVEVTIDEPGSLLPGMNVDASIVVDSAEDVLAVPVSAVQRGGWVAVKGGGAAAAGTTQTNTTTEPAAGGQGQPRPSGGQGQKSTGAAASGAAQPANGISPATGAQTATGAPTSGSAQTTTAGSTKTVSKAPTGAPAGFTYVKVEVGINDDDYIEIKSGLSEGDTVYLPRSTSGTETTTTTTMPSAAGGMGAMGGMTGGGAPPSGGR